MRSVRKFAGFTLIEVMVVVAIVAILASIAIPSYSRYVIKSNRAVGKGLLMDIASRQEAFRADRHAYATTMPALGLPNIVYISKDGTTYATSDGTEIYTVTLAAGATATSFTLTATPQKMQTRDTECGTLSLTSTGIRSASGSLGVKCWQ